MSTVGFSFAFQTDAFQADAFADAGLANIKTFDALDTSTVKTVNGVTVTTGVKTWDGLTK